MKGDVKNLEIKMVAGFWNEGTERKKICDGCEAKMDAGFKNDACERTKVYYELMGMKEDGKSTKLDSCCAVSSAASTVYGCGFGIFYQNFISGTELDHERSDRTQ